MICLRFSETTDDEHGRSNRFGEVNQQRGLILISGWVDGESLQVNNKSERHLIGVDVELTSSLTQSFGFQIEFLYSYNALFHQGDVQDSVSLPVDVFVEFDNFFKSKSKKV